MPTRLLSVDGGKVYNVFISTTFTLSVEIGKYVKKSFEKLRKLGSAKKIVKKLDFHFRPLG